MYIFVHFGTSAIHVLNNLFVVCMPCREERGPLVIDRMCLGPFQCELFWSKGFCIHFDAEPRGILRYIDT